MSAVRGRILLVEDDDVLAGALAVGLRAEGFAVDTCSSAEAALGVLSQSPYDVVVSDLNLGGMDGLELCTQMAELVPGTPLIVMTGFGSFDTAVQAVRAGAYDFLSKPVDADVDDGGALHPIIEDMGHDTALLEHLTPSSMELFNTAVGNREGVAYGCIVAAAPPPSFQGRLRVGVDPVGQLGYALFSALHRLCALSKPRAHWIPTLEQRRALETGLGRMPETSDSDAFVPTLSQVWGQVIDARFCDHLDLMGYYGEYGTDLLPCAADFRAADFERVWQRAGLFALDPDFLAEA